MSKATSKSGSKAVVPMVVTANNLRTGDVVYLGEAGQWVRLLSAAKVAVGEEAVGELEAVANAAHERDEVVAVYAMPVAVINGKPAAVSVREKIRAALGPTVGIGAGEWEPAGELRAA